MKNNRGLSLIEVIIVLAIMAIVAGAGLSFMSMIGNNNVKQCTNKISSTISKVRVDAMSKSKDSSGLDNYMVIMQDASNGQYLIKRLSTEPSGSTTVLSEEVIGDDKLTIKVIEQGTSAADFNIASGATLVIKFDRSTGGFHTIDGTNYCKEIIITNGKMTKKIILAPRTGKVTVE